MAFSKKGKKSLFGFVIVLIGLLVIIGGVYLFKKDYILKFFGRASTSTGIQVGKLVAFNNPACYKCKEECPGGDNVLRNCHPPETDGTSQDSLCNEKGRIESCGPRGQLYYCSAPGAKWTIYFGEASDSQRTPVIAWNYWLLKEGGSCVPLQTNKSSAEPLLGMKVLAAGAFKGAIFYASSLAKYNCKEECPGADNVLRNCHPPEADGTSQDSLCNISGRIEFCGTQNFCCPKPRAAWTTNLSLCGTPSPSRIPIPTATSRPTPSAIPR